MPGYPGWLARPAGAVLLAVLWLACAAPPAVAAELVGRVVSVADGDTLTLLHGRLQVKVRLTEIDAPERGQPFGKRATQSLSALCGGKTARVVLAGTDRYQRTLGRVWCQGVDTSAEQVRRGLAWVYDQYVTDPSLYALQDAARRSRAGLWTEPAPVSPWLWRQGVTAVTANGQPLPPAASNAPIIGNRRSRIYHLPGRCPSYNKVSARNRVPFDSEATARAAGYRKARNCR